MNIIEINNLTKKYPNNKGIFNVNLQVKKGEVFGYLGPNGAGKTTTIRHLVGFIKPGEGNAKILGLDVWKDTSKIQEKLGYLPGELVMPEQMKGTEFIKYIFNIRKMKDWSIVEKLIDYWEFNPNVKIKRMSKGMKQKVGLIIAFMHNPDVLILDEPTSGLDPLMQDKFAKLINEEKEKGKTIIMSSHIFQEIEKTCDRVAIIKSGKIVSQIDMHEIKDNNVKTFEVKFNNKNDLEKVKSNNYKLEHWNEKKLLANFVVEKKDINEFISNLAKVELMQMREIPYSLEEHFMKFYETEREGKANV